MPSSATKKGVTTIKWGTDDVLTNAAFTSAVVIRMTATPKNGDPIEIEGNQGFAHALVLLDDGFNATVECLYDSAITWPTVGSTTTLKRPGDGAALTCLVTSIERGAERKREATLTMRLVYRPDISLP
jgi:hypothetical protein